MAEKEQKSIEELEEEIRIKKEKLAKSEAHSNKNSTKTKPLKESQLKGSIHEAEKRLKSALAEMAEQQPEEEVQEEIEEPVYEQEEIIEEPEVQEEVEETIEEPQTEQVENVQENGSQTQLTTEQERQELREFLVSNREDHLEAERNNYWHSGSWKPDDIDKTMSAIKLYLDEQYEALENKQTGRGEQILSVDETREKNDSQDSIVVPTVNTIDNRSSSENKVSGIRIEKGEIGGLHKEFLESIQSSTSIPLDGTEREIRVFIDYIFRKFGNIEESEGHPLKEVYLKEAIDMYYSLEKVRMYHNEKAQKKEDLGMHEAHIGEFSSTVKEKVKEKKKGISGLLGKTEEKTQTRQATKGEMLERKVDAEAVIKDKLEKGEINQNCFNQVSGALDRLYGVAPEKVSVAEIQGAKDDLGLKDPEPVVEDLNKGKGEQENQTTKEADEDGLD